MVSHRRGGFGGSGGMEETLTFQPMHRLTGSAYRALSGTFHGHDYRADIEKGRCQLWRVNPGRLFIITRIEDRELVVCCAAGRGMVAAAVYLLAAAMNQGLTSVRFHSRRPALARLMRKAGFPFVAVERCGDETVYRMGVPQHGR